MRKASFLGGLILLFGIVGRSLQEETTAEPGASVETTTPAAEGAPTNEPKSETQADGSAPAAGSTPGTDSPPPADLHPPADSTPAAGGGGKCKPDEVLSDNGCVPKQEFLEKVVMESWKDEGFKKEKETIGVVDGTKCKANEVKTAFGCAEPKDKMIGMERRVRVFHSHLNNDKEVVHSSSSLGRHDAVQTDDDELERPRKKKRNRVLGPPVTGKDRPRKYVFLPGRRLRTGRKCRPYEVSGRKHRCIRRRRPSQKPKEHDEGNEAKATI